MSEDVEITAFVLKLKPGHEAEYKKRHDELWPEMKAALLAQGILRYEIYLERETGLLFAHMRRRRGVTRDMEAPVMRRWRQHMADILEQDGDYPWRRDLPCMFVLDAAG
jgi:L-rhamnose mutarotase